jgi:hypothetical protein
MQTAVLLTQRAGARFGFCAVRVAAALLTVCACSSCKGQRFFPPTTRRIHTWQAVRTGRKQRHGGPASVECRNVMRGACSVFGGIAVCATTGSQAWPGFCFEPVVWAVAAPWDVVVLQLRCGQHAWWVLGTCWCKVAVRLLVHV